MLCSMKGLNKIPTPPAEATLCNANGSLTVVLLVFASAARGGGAGPAAAVAVARPRAPPRHALIIVLLLRVVPPVRVQVRPVRVAQLGGLCLLLRSDA